MDTSWSIRHRFNVEVPRGKFVEITQFWKANPRRNYHIDSMWKFRRGFDFQNQQKIDWFSTCIFLCRFDVERRNFCTRCFHSIISLHFLFWEPFPSYTGIVLSRCIFIFFKITLEKTIMLIFINKNNISPSK